MLGSQMGVSTHEPQCDAIPDFQTMVIREIHQAATADLSETQALADPNSFPKEFECWDLRY